MSAEAKNINLVLKLNNRKLCVLINLNNILATRDTTMHIYKNKNKNNKSKIIMVLKETLQGKSIYSLCDGSKKSKPLSMNVKLVTMHTADSFSSLIVMVVSGLDFAELNLGNKKDFIKCTFMQLKIKGFSMHSSTDPSNKKRRCVTF